MYAGHMNDGSSVQKHSAGPTYPYVVYAQEQPWGLGWGAMGMGYDSGPVFCYEGGAIQRAQELRKAYDERNKFDVVKFIEERAHWGIAQLLTDLVQHGVSRDAAKQHLRNFVDAQCSK